MRSKLYFISLTLLALNLLSGCVTTPQVFTDYDERQDFSNYQSFSWVHKPPMMTAGEYPISPLAENRMTNAIKQSLLDKGYVFVDSPNAADFTVVYTMGARDKIQVDRYPDSPYYSTQVYWGWGGYYYPYFRHYPFHTNHVVVFRDAPRQYTQGDIAIDIFDAKSKEPVWHAKASKRLSSKDMQSNANNAMSIATKLLAKFPLRADVQVNQALP